MSTEPDAKWTEGDEGDFTVRMYEGGAAVAFPGGCSATFTMWPRAGGTPALSNVAAGVPASTGELTFTRGPSSAQVGSWCAEWRVTYPDNKKKRFPSLPLWVEVRAKGA